MYICECLGNYKQFCKKYVIQHIIPFIWKVSQTETLAHRHLKTIHYKKIWTRWKELFYFTNKALVEKKIHLVEKKLQKFSSGSPCKGKWFENDRWRTEPIIHRMDSIGLWTARWTSNQSNLCATYKMGKSTPGKSFVIYRIYWYMSTLVLVV